MKRLALALLAGPLVACTGTAGGDTFEFSAFARGVEPTNSNGAYAFGTSLGWQVELTHARLHVGALYLNRSVPSSVASNTSCVLQGVYVAEVPGSADVDLLSADEQPFLVKGHATTERALAGELWLFGRDPYEVKDPTILLEIEGRARKASDEFEFEGAVTISKNRLLPPPNVAAPGAKPICKQRVVSPIPVDLRGSPGERLLLAVDAAGMFQNVDFAELELVPGGAGRRRFADDSSNQPSDNLFNGLRASAGVYAISWEK